jgi:hypothetical protein
VEWHGPRGGSAWPPGRLHWHRWRRVVVAAGCPAAADFVGHVCWDRQRLSASALARDSVTHAVRCCLVLSA